MGLIKNTFFCLLLLISSKVWAQSSTIRINEIVASNTIGIVDADGDYSDWIEIFNPTNQTIILTGWSLTDDEDDSQKWIFPTLSLKPNEFVVVFASGKDTVYNNEIHTNFKLSASGEYLGFFDEEVNTVTEFSPMYPELKENQSYAFYYDEWIISDGSTPGVQNELATPTELPLPTFNKEHGFYEQAFDLSLSSNVAGNRIFYTLNGNEPDSTSGILYKNPILITGTSIVRAILYAADGTSSNIATRTFLFADDVIHQSNTPTDYPEFWGEYVKISGNSIADYEMDPELVADSLMALRIKDALYSLPVISLISDKDNFFSSENNEKTGGIYMFTGSSGNPLGLGWERPVSFEYFDTTGTLSFQVNCGIKIHGGESRVPEKSPKHGFTLGFKEEYGPTKLRYKFYDDSPVESFNKIVLIGGFCNEWIHWDAAQRKLGQSFGRDIWSKDMQLEMGHPSAHSKYVHLYINGIYWGIYNASERVDEDFAESYMGNDKEDYDIIKDYSEVASGTKDSWNQLMTLANKGLKEDSSYQYIQGNNPDGSRNINLESYVDVDNLIDYMLLNFYGANTDWDHHNWVAIRNRVKPGNGYKFFAWDQEHVLKANNTNTTSEFNKDCPSNVFVRLKENESFKRRFADRVLIHCFDDGLLTPKNTSNIWLKRSDIVEKAIDAEAARWGDYRRDVHPYQTKQEYFLYDKDNFWIPEHDRLINDHFPKRTDILIQQLQKAGLYPNVLAPNFKLNGEPIASNKAEIGDILDITFVTGTVYYTLDGTDPVIWSKDSYSISASAEAYKSSISIQKSAKVCARILHNGEWSALRSQVLVIMSDFNDLKITEINYNPAPVPDYPDSDFEFIELKNTGTATLNLEGVKFIKGINYEFSENSILKPGSFIVLAANDSLLYVQTKFTAFGNFKGQLDNGGENIIAVNPMGDTIIEFQYNDKDGWPKEADGKGKTLVPILLNPNNDQNSYADWRDSYYIGGSPGADDTVKEVIPDKVPINNIAVRLNQYPNPFSDKSFIDYQLSKAAFVEIIVYNIMGEQVCVIENGYKEAGLHQTNWDGTSANKANVPNGVYLYRLHVKSANENQLFSRKIMLMRN